MSNVSNPWLTEWSAAISSSTRARHSILVAAPNCMDCGNHPRFDPTKSTTFSDQPGYKIQLGFGAVGTGNPQSTNCTIFTDDVGVAGREVSSHFLLCDAWVSGLANEGLDGLFGLNSAPSATWGISHDFQPRFETVFWTSSRPASSPARNSASPSSRTADPAAAQACSRSAGPTPRSCPASSKRCRWTGRCPACATSSC